MATPVPALSVIMPAYNEERSISAAIADVFALVAPHVSSLEIVVANDGSKDRTAAILSELAAHEPRLKAVNRINGGHGPAVITALNAASGDALLQIDADREISLETFAEIWAAFQKGDAVIGARSTRTDGTTRRVISKGLRGFLRTLFRHVPTDPNVPMKLFRRTDWEKVAPVIGADNPLPSVLIGLYLGLSGARIAEMPVSYRSREGSASTYRGWKLAKLCAMAVRTVIAFHNHPDIRALRARRA